MSNVIPNYARSAVLFNTVNQLVGPERSRANIISKDTKPRDKPTHAERKVTYKFRKEAEETVRYISRRTEVPYPVVPCLNNFGCYSEYLDNYERYINIVKIIDNVNDSRFNKSSNIESSLISDFIRKRIEKNQRKHLKRSQKRAENKSPDSVVKIKLPTEEVAEQVPLKSTLTEPTPQIKTPIAQKHHSIVEVNKEKEQVLHNIVNKIEKATCKLEELKTQPIQILHVHDGPAHHVLKRDTATGFESKALTVRQPTQNQPAKREVCKWCSKVKAPYLSPCTKHPNGTHNWLLQPEP